MPENLTFNIAGTGSINFVMDWALAIGYRPQILDTETGETIDNPQTNTEFLINNIFDNAKNIVSSYRIKSEVATSTQAITETVMDELSDICVEVG